MDLKKISLLLQTDKQKDVVKLMKDIIQSENKKYKNLGEKLGLSFGLIVFVLIL